MKKIHTTNYHSFFIEVAADCPATKGEIPALRNKKSIARLQYEILKEKPYQLTSDEVLFQVFAIRNALSPAEMEAAREKFFSKGQACFRASPLTKRYGWGVHNNQEGKIALHGCETLEYEYFSKNSDIKVAQAMRSKRKAVLK